MNTHTNNNTRAYEQGRGHRRGGKARMFANMNEGGRGPRGGHLGEGRGQGDERGRGRRGVSGLHGSGHLGSSYLGVGESRDHRFRGGRGRMFAGGELRLLLLSLVGEQSRHGYELIKAIEELTGGSYAPSPGIVYPTLSLLLDEGAIAQADDHSARKAFIATEAGRAELSEKAEGVKALLARLRMLAEAEDRHGSLPIRRAIDNLKVALRNRTNAESFDTETVHQIVDILDDAARRIERL